MTSRRRTAPRKKRTGRPQGAVWAQTRDRIIDAAFESFSSGGFGDTPVSALAHDAGVASALLYYYFESKSGLYKAVAETARSRLDDYLIAPTIAVVAHQASPEARLTTLVTFLAHRGGEDVGLHRLLLAADLEADSPEVHDFREGTEADLRRLYCAVAGFDEHGPQSNQERQLVDSIEILVLGIWLCGMRKGGLERLPKVVDAFVALLTGSLFEDDEREGRSGDASKGSAPRSPIPTPSEEIALEERLALIALHRFAASGFGKVSLKEIAGLAGVTTGAIFHYFDSKASLYRAAGALGMRQFASSMSTSDIYKECSQRQRVNSYLHTLGDSAVNLVDNHWIGVRVHMDARMHPPLIETRDEWARELEQQYRLVVSGAADVSCGGESAPDQELLPALLNVLTLGASWFTVRHGAEVLKPALLGLQRLIKVTA